MQVTPVFAACLLLAILFVGPTGAQCPANSEFTSDAPCDSICGVPCDFKGVHNICICMDGYLKDPKTQQCVRQNQCSIPEDIPVLRQMPAFSFACFA
ncbi:AGAP002636-PA [Anopheles gambiae str. PEST]|uniref:AGAP002636-PA n=2 Tax=gambiae species complex TaxID=44542 RepID=Q5TTW6_ANOGA|nr:accessory gland protein Acp62F [Anopheles gambiae]EAL40873.1 AGAP002636-PA [Anopheles gambiae str. PEST]